MNESRWRWVRRIIAVPSLCILAAAVFDFMRIEGTPWWALNGTVRMEMLSSTVRSPFDVDLQPSDRVEAINGERFFAAIVE